MSESIDLSVEEKLKLSVFYTVSKICKTVASDNRALGEFFFSKEAIELISEVIWKKLEVYSRDLEAFAKNRKQYTVNSEDAKLLVRRNPSLKEHITDFIARNMTEKVDKRKKLKGKEPVECTSRDVITID